MSLELRDVSMRVNGQMHIYKTNLTLEKGAMNVLLGRTLSGKTTLMRIMALGVAWLAGMFKDFYPKQDEFARNWVLEKRFEPNMDKSSRDKLYAGWRDAVSRTLSKR